MLDGEHPVRVLAVEQPGVLALGVHLVRGDHRPGQFPVRDLLHQLPQHRDLICLLVYRELGGGGAVVPDPGQQHRGAAAAAGAVQRFAVDPQVAAHAGPLRAGTGRRPSAQRIVIGDLAGVAEDPAEGDGVRPPGLPGPVPGRAQPDQQVIRRGRGPFRGGVGLVVTGHARGQRQRQQVAERVQAASPVARVIHLVQEPQQPRALLLIPAHPGAGMQQVTALAPRAGHRPGQRRPPLSRQVRGQQGRQRQLRARGGQHLRHHRHIRHHDGQHVRDPGSGRGGRGRLEHAGSSGAAVIFAKNQPPPKDPAQPGTTCAYPGTTIDFPARRPQSLPWRNHHAARP